MNLSHLVQNNEGEWYFDQCIMGYSFPPSPQAPSQVTRRVGGVLEEPVAGRREETETQGRSRGSQRLDREEAGRALRLLCKPWSLAPHSKKRVGTRKALLFKRK